MPVLRPVDQPHQEIRVEVAGLGKAHALQPVGGVAHEVQVDLNENASVFRGVVEGFQVFEKVRLAGRVQGDGLDGEGQTLAVLRVKDGHIEMLPKGDHHQTLRCGLRPLVDGRARHILFLHDLLQLFQPVFPEASGVGVLKCELVGFRDPGLVNGPHFPVFILVQALQALVVLPHVRANQGSEQTLDAREFREAGKGHVFPPCEQAIPAVLAVREVNERRLVDTHVPVAEPRLFLQQFPVDGVPVKKGEGVLVQLKDFLERLATSS